MFKLHSKASSATEAIEYVPAGANLNPGVLVKYSNGVLVVATTAPEYVTLGSAKSGENVPVKRILEDEIYETVLNASGSSLKLGDKVTVATGGDKVTATTTDGIFELVAIDGTTSGSKVRGLFRR